MGKPLLTQKNTTSSKSLLQETTNSQSNPGLKSVSKKTKKMVLLDQEKKKEKAKRSQEKRDRDKQKKRDMQMEAKWAGRAGGFDTAKNSKTKANSTSNLQQDSGLPPLPRSQSTPVVNETTMAQSANAAATAVLDSHGRSVPKKEKETPYTRRLKESPLAQSMSK